MRARFTGGAPGHEQRRGVNKPASVAIDGVEKIGVEFSLVGAHALDVGQQRIALTKLLKTHVQPHLEMLIAVHQTRIASFVFQRLDLHPVPAHAVR